MAKGKELRPQVARVRILHGRRLPRDSDDVPHLGARGSAGVLMRRCESLRFLALALLARCCNLLHVALLLKKEFQRIACRFAARIVAKVAGGRGADAENCHTWMPKMGPDVFLWLKSNMCIEQEKKQHSRVIYSRCRVSVMRHGRL